MSSELLANVTPYFGINQFRKDSGANALRQQYLGFGTFIIDEANVVEADLRYTENNIPSDLNSSYTYDFAGAYSRYFRDRTAFRFGAHYQFQNIDEADKVLSLFLGYKWIAPRKHEHGGHLFHTSYNRNFSDKKWDIWQFSPYYRYFSKTYGKDRSYILTARVDIIRVPDDTEGSSPEIDKINSSLDLDAKFRMDRVEYCGGFWVGTRVYSVREDGMEIINHGYVERGGYSLRIRYQFTHNFWFNIGANYTTLTSPADRDDYSSKDYFLTLQFY